MQNRQNHKLFSIPLFVCSLLLLITLALSTTQTEAAPAGFVTTCGRMFCYNGKVFNVAGTNNHYLGWGTQAEVDQVLNDAKAMNLNVVRTIMHSVRGSLDSTQVNQGTVPLKWNWGSTADSSNMGMKGVYILYWDTSLGKMAWNDSTANGLGRFDYVIWKAQQLGIKLDIALLDFWQWAGGVQQINANFKGGNYDMTSASDRYTFFFTDLRTKQFYKDWVSHVLNRTNSLTGIKYKDDPTIFAWDLMNEPEIGNATIGQAWITEMSAYVKSIDPYHLVASGNEGFSDAHAGSSPQLEMGIRTIDFATWHTYPTYHRITTNDVVNLINTNCQIAATGNKPVLLQEFAYPSTNSDHVSVYQMWLDTLYNNSSCAGWLFWRLEGKQQSGQYPPDNGEHFSVYNNGSTLANVFKTAAVRFIGRGSGAATSTPVPASTTAPMKTPTTVVPSKTPTVVPASTVVPTSQPAGFVKGINFNGSAVTIQGNVWLSYGEAKTKGLSVSGAVLDGRTATPSPATDAATKSMLNTSLSANADRGTLGIRQTLSNGTYAIYVWAMEYIGSNQRKSDLVVEGIHLATGLGDLAINQWRRYGPYTVTVSDGTLDLNLVSVSGRAMLMGLEIYSAGTGAATTNNLTVIDTAPVVNTPVPTMVPTSTLIPTEVPSNSTAPIVTFVKGINFNGGAGIIQGNAWVSYSDALAQGLIVSGATNDTEAASPNPMTDAATTEMLNTALYADADRGTLNVSQPLSNGTYYFYVWAMENEFSNLRKWDLLAEDGLIASGLGDLAMNQWRRYGPYEVTVADGVLNLTLMGIAGRAKLMGLEIYAAAANPAGIPVIPNTIPSDGTVPMDSGSTIILPSENTVPVSSPVAVIEPASTLSPADLPASTSLPGIVLPTSTALPMNPPAVLPPGTFVKGINFSGNSVVIQGNTWLSYADAFAQGLSVSGALPDAKALAPEPSTDPATAEMLNSLLYAETEPGVINLSQVLSNGNYTFYVWTMENWAPNQRKWDLVAEGGQVASGLGDLAMNQWQRYGPYTVTVSDGVLDLSLTGVTGRAMIMGLEIYTAP